jgi:CHAD domain-containing protein
MEPFSFTSSEARLGKLARALSDAGFVLGPWTPVRRTVLDTFDGRLHAAGLRLELRNAQRPELVLSGGGSAVPHVKVGAAPRFGSDLPHGPLRARLAPLLDVRALLPVLQLTGRQAVATLVDSRGKREVAVVLHGGVVLEGVPGPAPVWAAELDELQGYAKAADRARRVIRSTGLEPHPGDVVELVAAAAGIDLRGHSGSPTIALAPDEPALEAYRRVLANLAAAVELHRPGTIDATDPEFLHELRVAVRRTRSVLSESRRVLPTEVRARYREAFGWLGAVTGPARDLDVYVIEWPDYVRPLAADTVLALQPVLDHIARRRTAAYADLAEALGSDRYKTTMAMWRGWLDAAPDGQEVARDAGAPIGRVAADRIGVAQARMVAQGRAITEASPAEALHELRKDAKRLRYLLECLGGVLAPAPRKAFVQRLKALQDNLGEHQDTEVHAVQLRTFSTELFDTGSAPPETLVAVGQLAERFELRREAARREFARRFGAYDTRDTARGLDHLLRSALGS